MTSDGGTERKDRTEREVAAGREATAGREDSAERKDEKSAAPAKPAKGRRATGGGQQRTGVVPTRAAEDDPRSWGDAESGNDHDAWLKEQKPPHWG
ncbi:MAG TPA: hypothetical protein VGK98_20320 [Arthrobacter sp.]|uniref:hypothetical protein n=1 Tax=Arthrobacter sp. TaxID=1667 RepID=UPI002F40CF3C